MKEEWKQIKNYNNYEISNLGNIRYTKTKDKVKTVVKEPCGYVYVRLNAEGVKSKEYRVHKLVLRHFKSEPPRNNSVVGHKDNVKTNNRIDNLYWTTTQDNTNKAIEDGLINYRKGFDNKQSKYVKVLDKSGNIVGIYGSIRECARCVENVTSAYISRAIKNKTHKPRSKRYIYEECSFDEFVENFDLLRTELVDVSKSKTPLEFLVIDKANHTCEVWDNQSALSRKIGITQAEISNHIKNNATVGNLEFRFLKKKDYKDSSCYENLLEKYGVVNIRNVFSGELKSFKTLEELKEYFNLKGNSYSRSGCLIFGEWEVV